MGMLLRNWHLKLSAVLLATVLYTGLVFSGSFQEDGLSVRVQGINQPDGSIVMSGDLGLVDVQYRTSREFSTTVSDQAFAATVDLSEYDMERAPEPQVLDVEVDSLFDGIEVLDVQPPTVRVAIDRIEVRTVPVEVDPGEVPDGLELGDPILSADEVEVRGPASIVGAVDRVVAPIRIDESGIDVNQPVGLRAVDVQGQEVGTGFIDIDPETVSVQVDVRAVETETTVAVRPTFEPGTPAPGFALEAISVDPPSVTIVGLPEDLSEIVGIPTEPLSIDGASETQVFEAQLELPDGVELADGAEPVVTVTATIGPSVSSRTFVVGVVCVGAGANECLPSISQLAITLSGPGGALSALGAGDLTPSVDATGLAPGTYDLTPSVAGLPEGVALLSISPGSVTVTINAPATPSPTPAP
ncbi:MAG: CdaR family protein [Candidatus Limnocylindria bacterium]